MVFSMEIGWLDFFAGPDENEHQGKEADRGQKVENVSHRDWDLVGVFEEDGDEEGDGECFRREDEEKDEAC